MLPKLTDQVYISWFLSCPVYLFVSCFCVLQYQIKHFYAFKIRDKHLLLYFSSSLYQGVTSCKYRQTFVLFNILPQIGCFAL